MCTFLRTALRSDRGWGYKDGICPLRLGLVTIPSALLQSQPQPPLHHHHPQPIPPYQSQCPATEETLRTAPLRASPLSTATLATPPRSPSTPRTTSLLRLSSRRAVRSRA